MRLLSLSVFWRFLHQVVSVFVNLFCHYLTYRTLQL